MCSSLRSPPPVSIRAGCSPTSFRDQRKWLVPGWSRCSATPVQATSWSLPQLTGSGGPAPKAPRTIADLVDRRIVLRALREAIDTATPSGRAVAAIMATLAELELELGRERRAASRESRRTRRLPATKPPKLREERQQQLCRLACHR